MGLCTLGFMHRDLGQNSGLCKDVAQMFTVH